MQRAPIKFWKRIKLMQVPSFQASSLKSDLFPRVYSFSSVKSLFVLNSIEVKYRTFFPPYLSCYSPLLKDSNYFSPRSFPLLSFAFFVTLSLFPVTHLRIDFAPRSFSIYNLDQENTTVRKHSVPKFFIYSLGKSLQSKDCNLEHHVH